MKKIRKGDTVTVLTGRDKGKTGSVIELKFSDVSGAADVAYVLSVYKGDFF